MKMLRSSRRGFTLIETILAATLGSMVLLATVGVFMFAATSERSFASRFDHASDMARLQVTLRRAMQTLVMKENSTTAQSTEGQDETAPVDRPRILLGPDDVAATYIQDGRSRPQGAASVQRLELVLSTPPLPNALLGPAAGWASPGSLDALDFSLADLEGENTGGVRGVFELRPDGQRERLMRSVGLDRPNWPIPTTNDEVTGWTLWWRPMTLEEIDHLEAGGAWLIDEVQTDLGQMRLAAAAPLLRGLTECRWLFFDDREKLEAYQGLEMNDLPAYVELEIRTKSGLYANWMLEMGWTVGADPNADEDEEDTSGADGDANDEGVQSGVGGGAGQRETLTGGRGRTQTGGRRAGGRTNEPAPPRTPDRETTGGRFIHWEVGGGRPDGGG